METSKPKSGVPWPHAVSLVLAAEAPQQQDWAVSVAVGVARKLAAQHKVVLVDAAVGGPSLADKLGVDQAGGIVDVLFRGAAFATVAQRPGSENFFFLPLGPDAPPPEVLFQHPRWTKIAERLQDASAHLLICVSAEDWLGFGPISGFEPSIILNGTGGTVELPSRARRFAEFLAPPAIREAVAASAESEGVANEPIPAASESEAPASSAAGPPGLEPAGLDRRRVPPRPDVVGRPEPEGMALGFSRSRGVGSGSSRDALGRRTGVASLSRLAPLGKRVAVPVVLVAAVLTVAVVWAAFRNGGEAEQPGAFQAVAETTTTANRVPPPAAEEPSVPEEKPTRARPAGTRLPYSVAIASYSSYNDALARQKKLTRSDLPVYVAPTPVRGVVYYRVFAGLVAERGEAQELMARLVRDGVKETISSWDVRPAQYAFSFGSFASVREASERIDALLEDGIQAYAVPVDAGGTDGEVAYHVYAGGYESREAAEPLREQIESAGLSAELIERVGLLER